MRTFRLAVLISSVVGFAAGCNRTSQVVPPLTSALADSADQVMFRVRFSLTDGGVQQAALKADSAYLFQQGNRIELRKVNTDFFSKMGEKTGTLTANQGTYLKQQMNMEARDSVLVVSADGRQRLTTQHLKYDQRSNLISTDSAFVFTQDGQVHRGVGFSTDPEFKSYDCKAACVGAFQITRPPS